MAKETEKKAAPKKDNFLKKFGMFFVNLFRRIVRSFREMFAEMKKVTWPSRDELKNYTLVVLVFMVFMGIVIGLIDAGSALLVNFIIG